MQERLISWEYLAKQVLCFKKLIDKERNPQTKNHNTKRKRIREKIELSGTNCNNCNNILF